MTFVIVVIITIIIIIVISLLLIIFIIYIYSAHLFSCLLRLAWQLIHGILVPRICPVALTSSFLGFRRGFGSCIELRAYGSRLRV